MKLLKMAIMKSEERLIKERRNMKKIILRIKELDTSQKDKEFEKFKKEEFEEMCSQAGVKREALCDTIFTRQFKNERR